MSMFGLNMVFIISSQKIILLLIFPGKGQLNLAFMFFSRNVRNCHMECVILNPLLLMTLLELSCLSLGILITPELC